MAATAVARWRRSTPQDDCSPVGTAPDWSTHASGKAPLDRGHRRLAELYRRLGATYECFGGAWPEKPKWMRQRTYARLLDEIKAAEAEHAAVFMVA